MGLNATHVVINLLAVLVTFAALWHSVPEHPRLFRVVARLVLAALSVLAATWACRDRP